LPIVRIDASGISIKNRQMIQIHFSGVGNQAPKSALGADFVVIQNQAPTDRNRNNRPRTVDAPRKRRASGGPIRSPVTTWRFAIRWKRDLLSTPMPARPITLSLVAAAMTSLSAFVAERTARPS